MSHSHNSYGEGFASDVFHRHGDKKEDEIGDRFDDTDDTETSNGVIEHAEK